MTEALFRKYKNYSGVLIKGTRLVEPLAEPYKYSHMHRAFWLTAQVEAPKWGTVQSYDGCGMSSGPLHCIAYQPRAKKQGSLFFLLRTIEISLSGQNSNVQALWDAFKENGWFVASDGNLRDCGTGDLISAEVIRNVFTPNNGRVPNHGKEWEEAVKWATLFYNVFSDSDTFYGQCVHAIEYLVTGQKSLEAQAYEKILGVSIQSPETLTVENIDGPSMRLDLASDLAMCVYHSHSVNAPSMARKCLKQALSRDNFAKSLIRILGTCSYGNWKDTSNGRSRYDRTRKVAMNSGLWSDKFFEDSGIMPENF